jgi:hypothetical protein
MDTKGPFYMSPMALPQSFFDLTSASVVGGEALTVATIRDAVEALRRNNVPMIDGNYYRLIWNAAEADVFRSFGAEAEEQRTTTASELGAMDRDAWRKRVCEGIDATRRTSPVTAAEIRARNGWRDSWRIKAGDR